MFKRSFKQGDLLLIAGVLTVALILIGIRWMNGSPEGADQISGGYYATIKVDNEIFRTVQLTWEPQYIEVRKERGYDLLKVHERRSMQRSINSMKWREGRNEQEKLNRWRTDHLSPAGHGSYDLDAGYHQGGSSSRGNARGSEQ
ncbi:hypothetical protein GCM10010913_12600 [Paenibacillus aceti]|uniref:DUF3139 domain-containing protein n=1 Tax=Paenibacillus aceti TaxID=1820010 RepID=A0ABQ1VRU3_9BACL|nr:hypothetical protein GCM10010913_12600 [Paenibacillus aceti]